MRRFAWLLFGCMGCDLTLGLRHFDPPPVDTPHVSGTLRERLVTNRADFTPQLGERFYSATDVAFSVTLDDGSTPPVEYDQATGTFAFERPAAGQAYRLQIDTPDLGRLDYQLTSSSPTIGLRTLSRIDSAPVTKHTTLSFQYGPTSGFALLASTGIGSNTNPQVPDSGTFDFDWLKASSFTGSIGLLDAAKNDRLYYTEMLRTGAGTMSYFQVSQYASAGVTMTDGVSQTVPGSLTPTTPGPCASIHASRNAALARQLAAAPRPYTGGADWSIHAGPSHELGPDGLSLIVFANEGNPATDVDVMPTFFNPFPGTELFATISSAGGFNVQLGGAAPVLLTDLTRTFMPLDVSGICFDNAATLKSEIAIPGLVTLDGTVLDADDKPVVLTSTDHVIEWASSTGPMDYANLFVYEVTSPGGATAIELRHSIVTSLGMATLPAELLVPGHTYTIQVENRLGYDVTTGNLDAIRYPAALSNVFSFTFEAR